MCLKDGNILHDSQKNLFLPTDSGVSLLKLKRDEKSQADLIKIWSQILAKKTRLSERIYGIIRVQGH